MKLQTKIMMVLFMAIGAGAFASNQSNGDPIAKILPSGDRDLLKLMYYNPGEKRVEVKFHDSNGVFFQEKLSSRQFKDGFLKFYDVKNLKDGNYWIEITDSEMSVKYQVTFNKDNMWVNYWNNYLPGRTTVALN